MRLSDERLRHILSQFDSLPESIRTPESMFQRAVHDLADARAALRRIIELPSDKPVFEAQLIADATLENKS